MKLTQKFLLAGALVMTIGITSASAQIFVNIRPPRPIVVQIAAPSPRHVWIDEDWEEVDGQYIWRGGHWAEPPHEGDHYRAGHWDHEDRGHRWRQGGWDHDDEHGHHHDRDHKHD